MNKCKIIMYHYVRSIKKSPYPEIKGLEIKQFTNQINFFKRKFNFISLDKIYSSIFNNEPIDDNSILLTFDDGLKDHYENVFPILKKNNISGTFFVPSEPLINKIVLDVHKIHHILNTIKDTKFLIKNIFEAIESNRNKFVLRSNDDYLKEFANENRFDSKEIIFVKRMLQKGLPEEIRNQIVADLFQKFIDDCEENFSNNLYLSKEEISEMIESGMNFGTHGTKHEWFTNMNKKSLEEELKKSKNFSKNYFGKENPLTVCFPYGGYNSNVINAIKKFNFKLGFTTEINDAILTTRNALTLPRYDTNDFPT